MAISLNLNLSCAQPGEGHFLNLTIARSFLTLAERFASFQTCPKGLSRPTHPSNVLASFRSRASKHSVNQP